MELKTWPFRPNHITSDGDAEKWQCTSLAKLTGEGIIPNEHLQGIQTTICANLDSATTLIEFSPNGESIRTDSKILSRFTCPPCAAFRACTNDQLCHRSDNLHAHLLYGLTRETFVHEVELRLLQLALSRAQSANPSSHCRVAIEPSSKRPYVEFDCPMLGYRELLFPIFNQNRVIAAFFVGQLLLAEREMFVAEQQQLFFAASPFTNEWEAYSRKNPEIPANELAELVKQSHDQWFSHPENILESNSYADLIRQSCLQLADFEQTLDHQMEIKREAFIHEKMAGITAQFQHDDSDGYQAGLNDPLPRHWTRFQTCLGDIVREFAIEYIIVFGVSDPQFRNGLRRKPLRIVASAGGLPKEVSENYGKLRYDMSALPAELTRKAGLSSDEAPELFRALLGLPEGVIQLQSRLYYYATPIRSHAAAVILFGYNDANPADSVENHIDGRLDSALKMFFTAGLSTLAAALQAVAQEQMATVLQVFGHEMGQVTVGLDWLRELYLSDPDKLRDLDAAKARDLTRDIEGYLRQLSLLGNTASLVLAVPKPNKQYFWAYRELLFKWKDIYRLEAERKNLQFVMVYPEPGDPGRPQVYGDCVLLEQLLYNLVGNAVKYCYRGTKLYLDYRKVWGGTQSSYVFTVTDFGRQVAGDKELYDLFRRGENLGETGMGIGLYVAKQIAGAHGGRIEHAQSAKISSYNIPLMKAYVNAQRPDPRLLGLIQTELDELVRTGVYHEVVALDVSGAQRYLKPFRHELLENIKEATYRVTFTVTIPAPEGIP